MSTGIEITDKRRKWDQLFDSLSDANGSAVRFGSVGPAAARPHQPNDGGPAQASVATILAYHEFGTGTAPERSVIRAWVDGNKRELGDAFRTGVLQQLAGVGSTSGTLELVGKLGAEGMRRRIRGFIQPELGPWAAQDPHRDQRLIPLLDTEQIIESIGYESDV